MQGTTVGKARPKLPSSTAVTLASSKSLQLRSSSGDCVEAPDTMTGGNISYVTQRAVTTTAQRANGTKGDVEAPVRPPGKHVRDERHRAR